MIDWNSWIDPHFGPVGITVTALVTAWILYRVARATPTRVARTRQAVESRPDGRVRFHRQFIARQWMLCAVALLPLLTDRGVDAADYGLRYPGSSQTGLALFAFVAAVLLF
ncbi:hypothetical protein, partial [Dactylosporangium sp. NPDC048998]|uniref:hypothetical protein n=1 Tax=Dactylosporangium sp. NPDC048998 TaxID=3363976 RepID=UPI00371E863D